MAHYAAACALGVVSGAGFAWLWLRVVPAGTHRRFWSAMSGLTRELLVVDEARAFLRLYRRLATLVGGYLARNLGGTALACLPPLAVLLTVAPLVFDAWDERVSGIEAAYFAALGLTTIGALLWPGKRRS